MNALRRMLTEKVQHWLPPTRDVFGNETKSGSTPHAARVVSIQGKVVSALSRTDLDDAKAVIWLLNHPRMIAIGETFELPNGEALKVVRTELRTTGSAALHKVWLS